MCVRVNDCSSRWALRDLLSVVGTGGDRLDCIMIPKVESPGQVQSVDFVITQLEMENGWQAGRIGLELQIESAGGLLRVREILAASDRAETLVFGPGDMAAALGMPSVTVGDMQPDYPGDHWHWVLYTVLVHARDRGVQAIDGPYAKVRDTAGFREVATRSHTLGFDGKWALHPAQIDVANEVYGVGQRDYERAVDILEACEHATSSELRGAVMFGAEMIDEATRKMAQVNAEKGARQGVAYRSAPAEIPFHERARWRREPPPES